MCLRGACLPIYCICRFPLPHCQKTPPGPACLLIFSNRETHFLQAQDKVRRRYRKKADRKGEKRDSVSGRKMLLSEGGEPPDILGTPHPGHFTGKGTGAQ